MKITIPDIPESSNKYNGRHNVHDYRRAKECWRDLVYWHAKGNEAIIGKVIIRIEYFFKTKARHDPDNYAGKMILDGLTESGVIEDDSFDFVTLILRGSHDAKNPRTEIVIVPYNDKALVELSKK